MAAINKEIEIRAPRSLVWRFLTEPERMSKWMMAVSGALAVGEDFTLTGPPQNEWDGTITCKVLEMTEPEKFVFTWNHNILCADTLVTVTLEEYGDGTRLRLLHTNWDDITCDLGEALAEHSGGWDHHLGALKGVAETA